jgi:hypothetical protein
MNYNRSCSLGCFSTIYSICRFLRGNTTEYGTISNPGRRQAPKLSSAAKRGRAKAIGLIPLVSSAGFHGYLNVVDIYTFQSSLMSLPT